MLRVVLIACLAVLAAEHAAEAAPAASSGQSVARTIFGNSGKKAGLEIWRVEVSGTIPELIAAGMRTHLAKARRSTPPTPHTPY